jgi:hypothetical protein
MAGMLQMRRTRGAASGFLLALLGIWGAIIPFIGPYFHYAFTPDASWTYTTARLWLEILPGAAVFLGGVLLIIATGRHIALFGALLAALAGGWFALGTVLSPLWSTGGVTLGGTPVASTTLMRIMEQVGFFTGLGAVVIFVAAAAFGRITAVSAGLREVAAVPATTGPMSAVETEEIPVRSARTEVLPVRNTRTEENQTTPA